MLRYSIRHKGSLSVSLTRLSSGLVDSSCSFCSSSQGGEGSDGSNSGMENGVKREEKVEPEKSLEDELGPPPEKPLPGDCCGSGCEICVWDTYYDDLKEYKERKKQVEESRTKTK